MKRFILCTTGSIYSFLLSNAAHNTHLLSEAKGPLLISYIILINLIGFLMMGADKKKAIRGAWRIREASFFSVALLGGALGCTLGMHYFRHKTKHWYFKYGMPLIFLAECILFLWLCRLLCRIP